MAVPTYIVEASALNDGIHLLKQWVYEGSVSLIIPQCTYDAAEKAFKASVAPKEVQKDSAPAKPFGRAARKEQPLFDINPRTVWEFLLRAKSEKGEQGVKFQQENEEFTQWKEEEEKEAEEKAETPTAPTSFADALLRKLTIKEDKTQTKGPSKPRLVARSNDQKSPWKMQKIPVITSKNIDEVLKPLFSCVLWRVYEFENNQLQPEKFVLLVRDFQAKMAAEKLGLPVVLFSTARSTLTELHLKNERREDSGQLEAEFPEVLAMSHNLQYLHSEDEEKSFPNGDAEPALTEHQIEGNIDRLHGALENQKASDDDTPALESMEEAQKDLVEDTKPIVSLPAFSPSTETVEAIKPSSPKLHAGHMNTQGKGSTVQLEKTHDSEIKIQELIQQDDHTSELTENQKPSKPALNNKNSKVRPASDSDLGSDEEIIVFNPRARRASGLSKKNKDGTRSRPTTSNGYSQKLFKTVSKEVAAARPATSAGPTVTGGSSDPVRSPMVNGHHPSRSLNSVDERLAQTNTEQPDIKPYVGSKLKAESAIFIPGQPFVPSQASLIREATPPVPIEVPPEPSKSPALPAQPRNAPPRHPRAGLPHRNTSQEELRQQRESQRIIQRQREAIQRQERQAKAVEEKPKAEEKPPPRQIKLEPTDNPTIIDPDAFDRSYVVQAPSSSPSTNSSAEKRRSRTHHPRGNHSKGSPKRAAKANGKAEADVDYVLKSGAPRGSVRGKGKLWIP